MITVEKLTKFYGAHAAIRDLSLSIQKGEVVGLLGLNGAGKTTTLRILSGALIPTSGLVMIEGENMVTHPDALKARVGFLPEFPPLYPEMTVHAFLAYVASLKGVSSQHAGPYVQDALRDTDLLHVQNEVIGTLSNGYQRRVGIAMALVHKPALVLLDEPTSGLDPVQIVHMRHVIRSLRGKQTVVVSSHILAEVQQVCDTIVVLQEGRVVAQGTEQALAAQFLDRVHIHMHVRGELALIKTVLEQHGDTLEASYELLDNNVWKVAVQATRDCREEYAREVVHKGMGLLHMAQVRLELESIFLSLSKGGQA